MYPVLFRIGEFEITSFGVLVAVALVGPWLFRRELRRSRLPDSALDAVAGVIGGWPGRSCSGYSNMLAKSRLSISS